MSDDPEGYGRNAMPAHSMSKPDGGGVPRSWRWVAVAFAAAALPVVVALLRIRGQHWYPSGDMAQAEFHLRGIWQHPPLVGAAGRITGDTGIQGSHPGPSLWFAMYPVYALFGRSSFGLMAGAASVHLVAIAGALVMVRRRGGTALVLLVGLMIVVIVRSSGPMFFIEPWNPWLALFPFLVFVLATVGGRRGQAACGSAGRGHREPCGAVPHRLPRARARTARRFDCVDHRDEVAPRCRRTPRDVSLDHVSGRPRESRCGSSR